MALKMKMVFLFLSIPLIMEAAAEARHTPITKPGLNLAARLETSTGGGGGSAECWNALIELKSCSNEIILFFLNGETDIGPDCCGAIDIITRDCWPAMLTSLGFTAEEGNILRGYCDGGASPSALPPATAK